MQPVGLRAIFGVCEPRWEGEVPERHDWLDTSLLQLPAHRGITLDRFLIVMTRLRLHTSPLDAESVVGHADLLQCDKVLLKVTPTVERIAHHRSLPLLDQQVPVAKEILGITRLFVPVFILKAACGDPPGEGGISGELFSLVAWSLVEGSQGMNGTTAQDER